MANITLSTTESNIVVDSTNNIITVSSTPTTVIVGESLLFSNAQIRSALSNTFPVTYNSTTGVFGLDSTASFIGKTTDDLPEKISAPSNQYFTQTRARQSFARQNVSGDGRIEYNSTNGIFSYYGPEAANYRAVFSAVSPLNYNSATGVFSINANAVLTGSNTDSLAEGTTNLYYTTARANTAIDNRLIGGTGISYSSGTIAVDFTEFSTSNITEGTNLYWTTARGNTNSDAWLTTKTTTNLAEGTNLYYTDARANSAILAYTAANPITVGGNLTVNGNINATGNINVQNVTDLYVRDQIIVLNANAATNANVQIISNRPTATSTSLRWNEQSTRWEFTNNGTTYFPMPTSTTDLAEGTNLYFTNARANAAFVDSLDNISTAIVSTANITTSANISAGTLKSDRIDLLQNESSDMGILVNMPRISGGDTPVLYLTNAATGTGTASNWKYILQTGSFQPGSGNGVTPDITWSANGNNAAGANYNFTDFKVRITGANQANNTLYVQGNITSGQKFVGDGSALTGITTTQVSEGANLYYTTDRANTAIGAYQGSINTAGNITTTGLITGGNITTPVNGTIGSSSTFLSGNGINVYNAGSINTLVAGSGFRNLMISSATSGQLTPQITSGVQIYTPTNTIYAPNGGLQTPDIWTANIRGRDSVGANSDILLHAYNNVNVIGNIVANSNAHIGNVITNNVFSNSGQNLTLNTTSALITRQKYSNVDVFSGNISSDGYAFFNSNLYNGQTDYFNYSGTTGIKNFIINTGNATLGSNAITGVSLINFNADAAESLSNLKVNAFFSRNEADFLPFPVGTRVTSVDVANSIVYMSANAVASANLAFNPNNLDVYELNSALHDNQTGLTVVMISAADIGAGSNTTLFAQQIYPPGRYGYPATGPVITDFDVATDGSVSDYSLGAVSLASFFIGRNKISSPKSVFQAPRGLIVGESADLTNRAENDSLPSFGVNVLWDGRSPVTDYGGNAPLTQILVKNYTTNNLQSGNRTNAGPRLFFTAAEGDSSQPLSTTYPKKNLELGRISWWSTSSTQAGLSSVGPPAYISAVTGQDCVDTNSGVGMYFGISPNTLNFDRSLFMASSMGNTLIASAQDSTGTHRPIIFAPSHRGSNAGNAALLYNQTILGNDTITDTIQTSGAHFAQINYNNDTALTGSRMAVTNGNNTNSSREGNVVLSIDRNYNSGNANVRVRTGNTNYYGSNNPDRVRFTFAPAGLVDGTAVTIRNFTNATVAAALNGNVFYVKRNDSGGYIGFELYSDSGLTTPVNLGVTNVNAGAGTFEYTRNNGVTAKDWSFTLPQGSNNLILTEDGVARTTFESGGNVTVTGNINLTGRLLGYDRVYGEFCYTGGNIQPAAPDTIYAFPLDTTNMASDVVANNTSRVNITKPGIFKLIMSLQVKNSDNAADHIMRFWLRKNGADVANSATLVTPLKLQESVISMDWMVESDGDDYWEIAYYVNNTGVSFPYYAAGTSPVTYPAAPPIILNVIPVGA